MGRRDDFYLPKQLGPPFLEFRLEIAESFLPGEGTFLYLVHDTGHAYVLCVDIEARKGGDALPCTCGGCLRAC